MMSIKEIDLLLQAATREFAAGETAVRRATEAIRAFGDSARLIPDLTGRSQSHWRKLRRQWTSHSAGGMQR